MFRASVFLLAVAAMASARSAFEFSAGVEAILSSPISTSFACDGLPYGYYADTDNNCEIFHVCLPIQDDEGQIIETAQFSFACGNQTVFSQDSLTCNTPDAAFPCSEAASLYDSVNAEFGRIPDDN